MDKVGTNGTEFSGKRVIVAIRSLVNASDFHKTLLLPVLTYGSETMLWKERARIRALQMDNLRVLLGIRRMDGLPNGQIRELSGEGVTRKD